MCLTDIRIKRDQLDVTCFIISLFTAQLNYCKLIPEQGPGETNPLFQTVTNIQPPIPTLTDQFSLHKDTTPPQPNHTVTPTHIEPGMW